MLQSKFETMVSSVKLHYSENVINDLAVSTIPTLGHHVKLIYDLLNITTKTILHINCLLDGQIWRQNPRSSQTLFAN